MCFVLTACPLSLLAAEDAADSITFVFEGAKSEKISDFELKLMDIDGEFLGIPETEYNASITMPR